MNKKEKTKDGEMTWNHRVIRVVEDKQELFGIHEVFYFEGQGRMVTCNPVAVCGESLDELKETLGWMQKALKRPALEYSDFEKGGKYYFEDDFDKDDKHYSSEEGDE